jgi:hypothetical protein
MNYLNDVSMSIDNGFVVTGNASTIHPPNDDRKIWVLKVDSTGCEIADCWVGMEEHGGGEAWKQGALEIWPNPASQVISVKCSGLSSGRDCSVVVYDIFGRNIDATVISLLRQPAERAGDGGWAIDVSTLPPGLYFVAVMKDGQQFSACKVVVAR